MSLVATARYKCVPVRLSVRTIVIDAHPRKSAVTNGVDLASRVRMRSLILSAVLLCSVAAAPPPARTIKAREHVVFRTAESAEPAGPYLIEGAEPGDLLVVTIEKLEPHDTTGTSPSVMADNVFDAGGLSNRAAPTVPWTINKAKGTVSLDLRMVIPRVDWAARYTPPVYELPLAPVVTAIGTAPGGKTTIASAGARVMLPVNEAGALLTFGRGYARRADGEAAGSGIETALDVTFSVDVVKKKEWPHSSVARASTIAGEFPIEWPRVETSAYLMAAGTAPTLQEALQHATTELHHWLDDDFGFSERSLSIFFAGTMEYEVVDAQGPAFVVIAKVKKAYIPKIAATE